MACDNVRQDYCLCLLFSSACSRHGPVSWQAGLVEGRERMAETRAEVNWLDCAGAFGGARSDEDSHRAP